jgi:hypothetical protein
MSVAFAFPERHQPVKIRTVAGQETFFYGAKRYEDTHVHAADTTWADAMPFDLTGMTHLSVVVIVNSGTGWTVHLKGAMDDADPLLDLPTPVVITTAGVTRITDFPLPLAFLTVTNPSGADLTIKIYATR